MSTFLNYLARRKDLNWIKWCNSQFPTAYWSHWLKLEFSYLPSKYLLSVVHLSSSSFFLFFFFNKTQHSGEHYQQFKQVGRLLPFFLELVKIVAYNNEVYNALYKSRLETVWIRVWDIFVLVTTLTTYNSPNKFSIWFQSIKLGSP